MKEKRIIKINKIVIDKGFYVKDLEYDIYRLKLFGLIGIDKVGEEKFYMNFNNVITDYGFTKPVKKDEISFKKYLDLFYFEHVFKLTVPSVDEKGILHLDKEINIY
jgi:hypothetical protein